MPKALHASTLSWCQLDDMASNGNWKSALSFSIFWSCFLDFGNSSWKSSMLCNIVWKSYWRVFYHTVIRPSEVCRKWLVWNRTIVHLDFVETLFLRSFSILWSFCGVDSNEGRFQKSVNFNLEIRPKGTVCLKHFRDEQRFLKYCMMSFEKNVKFAKNFVSY